MTKILHQNIPNNWAERESLREKGQFWTPPWVADAMISYVAQETNLIFDPATGRGAFLEALLRLGKPNISFYGTDIDPDVLSDSIYKNKLCNVELRDFLKDPLNRKFKSIIANPPYIRHHRIDYATKSHLKELMRSIAGISIDGRAGYHIYFLVQALTLLEKGGRLAFIMPADTCEGKFANTLWRWISEHFCIEAVVTFQEDATPFPKVDTNPIVFFIRNVEPIQELQWVIVTQAYSNDLKDYVKSGFTRTGCDTLQIVRRNLAEAISTGLTRPVKTHVESEYYFSDFAKVMRGIATGANEFFFLTSSQVRDLDINPSFLRRAVGRTRDIANDRITVNDLDILDRNGRPTYLLDIDPNVELSEPIVQYLKIGEEMKLPDKALIKQRSHWYKMEKRQVPPLLFAYLGRRHSRFILNEANVVPLTGFLCVYTLNNEKEYVLRVWQALNDNETLNNLPLVGKSYGSGAIKVEPGNLPKLPIPEQVVMRYNLLNS